MHQSHESPFYRVSAKALIFDDEQRLLMLQNDKDKWEIPGGGWEWGETFEDCLRREIREEQGVDIIEVGPIEFVFQGSAIAEEGYVALRVVARARLTSHNFTYDDGIVTGRFVTADELEALPLVKSDSPILDYIDHIWRS